MKKINLLIVFFLMFGFIGCKNESILLIGDHYILSLLEEKGDTSFVFNKLTSQKLYYLLDKDASSVITNKKIIPSIKNSNKIILSLGIYDIVSLFDFQNEKNTININQKNKKIELLDYYIYHSFSLIKDNINKKTNVYVLSQFNPLVNSNINIKDFENVIEEVNVVLSNYSRTFDYSFVELVNTKEYLENSFILKEEYKNNIYDKVCSN